MPRQEILKMDVEEFFNWLAHESLTNDVDFKNRLLEEIKLEHMSDQEREAYNIKKFFMNLSKD